ncbi:low molecular weight protein-tyrosine-phosphatase [Staphylococcus massiliensis]|uniref:Low molecular weight protein-tyrosine-phosphatase PtpA n=1 Tax=Staphylococcus massiliensis S46 TaxID=1229783 RepID=K9ALD6_9STAP|nr:low molecular weight protein-tyrosine-phosphatase [Staphylococcus massiliensis]EKU46831.1 protein-tyrosine-phosphatase [Staphylococcus massiliensis S46]MCG3399954.1 low molecular weight phosphotyrosine protein phosphatase [Staphylococcus massiliensis]MCG3402673.1 low molecular weight phosphotyrosine protein phosphatase [Staphylococcus massiliensis]MCG3412920.1 low molecular weight phosphotyrosine protein phosphatase [Staphylococcus massiliensis]POA01570.1 low molecular weight phosphotyrosin
MVTVAFVCLGNICRSPMAEAIMKHRLKERHIDGIHVESRGTGEWNLGEPPHQGTKDILDQHHISYDGMISELFQPDDDFDYVIAMDQSNVDNIKRINPSLKGKLFKLLEFSDMDETDVPDPYYTNNFEGVYEMVQSSCDHLIDFIIEERGKSSCKTN